MNNPCSPWPSAGPAATPLQIAEALLAAGANPLGAHTGLKGAPLASCARFQEPAVVLDWLARYPALSDPEVLAVAIQAAVLARAPTLGALLDRLQTALPAPMADWVRPGTSAYATRPPALALAKFWLWNAVNAAARAGAVSELTTLLALLARLAPPPSLLHETLHQAVAFDQPGCVEVLLAAGASPDAVWQEGSDEERASARDVAIQENRPALLARFDRWRLENDKTPTPEDWAFDALAAFDGGHHARFARGFHAAPGSLAEKHAALLAAVAQRPDGRWPVRFLFERVLCDRHAKRKRKRCAGWFHRLVRMGLGTPDEIHAGAMMAFRSIREIPTLLTALCVLDQAGLDWDRETPAVDTPRRRLEEKRLGPIWQTTRTRFQALRWQRALPMPPEREQGRGRL